MYGISCNHVHDMNVQFSAHRSCFLLCYVVRGAVSIKPEGHPNPTGGGGIMRTEYLDRMRRSILFIDTNKYVNLE